MISINCNYSGLKIQNNLSKNTNAMSVALQRMSTGYKINIAADDASGLYVATSLDSQIRGLKQAQNNVSVGKSILNVAEGSLTNMSNMLNRIRDLAMQGANSYYSIASRNALQSEADKLYEEITRIKNGTSFNGLSLFQGNAENEVSAYSASQSAPVMHSAARAASVSNSVVPDGFIGIYTVEDLNNVRNNLGANYILMNDIDMSSVKNWNPIGDFENGDFSGSFNGNGHIISNLKVDSDNDAAGLFGVIKDGEVLNLGLENVNIKCGGQMVGGLAGMSINSKIKNCYVTGNIALEQEDYEGLVGGLIGHAVGGGIHDCLTSGTISSNSSDSLMGGIVGLAEEQNIETCYTNCMYKGEEEMQRYGLIVGGAYSCFLGDLFFSVPEASLENYDILSMYNVVAEGVSGSGGYIYALPDEVLLENESDLLGHFRVENWDKSTIPPKLDMRPLFTNPINSISEVPDGYIGIYTVDDFLNIKNNPSAKYILMRNIDFSSHGAVFPMGVFKGELNGNGHVITGLTINKPGDPAVGLFTEVIDATICNLGFESVTIKGFEKVGTIAGVSTNSTFSNCYVTGDISGYQDVGGLVGEGLYVTITDCCVKATVSGERYQVGGLAGFLRDGSQVSDCYAAGSISSKGYLAGGLVGFMETGDVTNCSTAGQIKSEEAAGGLIGAADKVTITDSYSSAKVIADRDAGGLVGDADKCMIDSCYTTGNVSGDSRAGGLVGFARKSTIDSCYTTGNTSGGEYIGGLVGYNSSTTIDSCYTTGDTSGNESIGGLVGNNEDSAIDSCYTTGNTSGKSYVGGLVAKQIDSELSNCYTTGNISGGDYIGGLVGLLDGNIDHCYTLGTVEASGCAGAIVGGYRGGTLLHVLAYTGETDENYWNSGIGNNEDDSSLGENYGVLSYQDFTSRAAWKDFDTDVWQLPIIKSGAATLKSIPKSLQNPKVINPLANTLDIDSTIRLQVGANSDEAANAIYLNISFNLDDIIIDLYDEDSCLQTVGSIDYFLNIINNKLASIGAVQNRLDSVTQSQVAQLENFTASKSTILDADLALESAEYVKSQILTSTSTAILTQSNNMFGNIAIGLINSLR